MRFLTNEDFKEAIKEGVTLVDFFATWCGPCKMLSPVVEQLAEEMGDRANFFKVDVDEADEIAAEFGIMSVPTLIVFKDGEPVKKSVGFQPKPVLKAMLEEYLA
ncbi:MAG: thioredoxin [Erysipelotrichales bacterium]|nr:thioredoxin [Erysipelotrichales bacterium]